MRRDPTEFRQRFLAYKEGKMPYENGLPKYKNGTSPYQTFVEEMGPVLHKLIVEQGVLNPEVVYRNMMTLLAYESNYGTSNVARTQNNYGGVGWNGKSYTTYKDKADFAKAYVRLMNSRYKNVIGADTLFDYAKGLKGLGYYEDTLENYARNLTGMKSFAKALNAHKINNPDLYSAVIQTTVPMSQTTAAELHAANLFQPPTLTIHSDYPINNPAPESISSWNNATSPAYTGSALLARRANDNINQLINTVLNDGDITLVLKDNLSKTVFKGKKLGFKNGKLPRYKIGHNVSHADKKDDGTFTDDYTKVFEDMYVTPLKTDLKRGSYTLNNFPYYLQHRTDWMKPFMSSGTNEKGLELVHPEFDLLLGGRLLVTEILPLKQSAKTATELINFKDFGKAVQKMKAEDDAFRAAHPEYEIDNFLKSRKIPDDSNILDVLSKSNLEEKPTRDIFHKLLYENENLHGKQIVNLHNNRARLTGDPVDEVGRVFDVDDPKGREAALQWLEDNYFGSREGAEYALKDPGIISRLKGFSLPKGDRPVLISKKKLVLHQELALGRKLTELEADDLYYKVISHERHHSFDRIHDIPEGFDLSKIKTGDYFAKDGFDELAARGTQLKNMFGLVNKPLTGAHLRYAESLYFKDPSNINNNMLEFFNLITDYNKAAKWLQDNASAIVPIGLSTTAVSTIPKYKDGKSPIHIKSANRGKFTALKKRTGHSASWFKENGTPEQKKMAVFALNAKKWKH